VSGDHHGGKSQRASFRCTLANGARTPRAHSRGEHHSGGGVRALAAFPPCPVLLRSPAPTEGSPMRTAIIPFITLLAGACPGADGFAPPRVVGEALIGTSNFEPGVAAEFRLPVAPPLIIRPELFVQNGDRPGIACAALWVVPFNLPAGHEFVAGPRAAYHNGDHHDDPKGELDGMAIYSIPIIPSQPGHHHIEIISALGLLDKDGTTIGFSVGAGYAYSF
jgi:hypothetical protein